MKVFFDGSREYDIGGQHYYHFDDLENEKTSLFFAHGIYAGYNLEAIPGNYKYRVYYEMEEPNGYQGGFTPAGGRDGRGIYLDWWNEIYSQCPYSCEWLNRYVYGDNKFKPILFPTNERYVLPTEEKIYDVFYQGHIIGNDIASVVETIKKFNYRFASLANYESVTDYRIPWKDKIQLNKKCKISVTANLLWDTNGTFHNITKIDKWKYNEAFSHLDKGIMPQIKPRVVDAGISKSLVLCLKDDWNVIEKWFEPGKHFLYFNSTSELESVIKDCLNNWDYCQKIVDNMYNEIIEKHMVRKFYENNLKKYDI